MSLFKRLSQLPGDLPLTLGMRKPRPEEIPAPAPTPKVEKDDWTHASNTDAKHGRAPKKLSAFKQALADLRCGRMFEWGRRDNVEEGVRLPTSKEDFKALYQCDLGEVEKRVAAAEQMQAYLYQGQFLSHGTVTGHMASEKSDYLAEMHNEPPKFEKALTSEELYNKMRAEGRTFGRDQRMIPVPRDPGKRDRSQLMAYKGNYGKPPLSINQMVKWQGREARVVSLSEGTDVEISVRGPVASSWINRIVAKSELE